MISQLGSHSSVRLLSRCLLEDSLWRFSQACARRRRQTQRRNHMSHQAWGRLSRISRISRISLAFSLRNTKHTLQYKYSVTIKTENNYMDRRRVNKHAPGLTNKYFSHITTDRSYKFLNCAFEETFLHYSHCLLK